MNGPANARCWRGRVLRAVVMLATAASPLVAQTVGSRDGRQSWSRVRVAKWALAGTALALGGYALAHSGRAGDAYNGLHRLCASDASACRLSGGAYADPRAERFFQATVRHDRRAQTGIIGGHTAMLGSVGLFVFDLRRKRSPENIPYPTPAFSPAPRHSDVPR